MSVPFSTIVAGVLHSGRDAFNARFAEMKRRKPALEADAFSAVLGSSLAPMAEAVAAHQPDRVPAVVWAAYDAALQLVAERLAGPSGRHPVIEQSWRELLPAVAPLLAQSPGRIIAAVSNALCHLASTPGADEKGWLLRMLDAAQRLGMVDEFLAAGQLAAWRSGLAHFREGALAAGDVLPESVAVKMVGGPGRQSWSELREQILRQPWWTPDGTYQEASLHVVKTAGSFRGFGGLFPEPPVVASVDGMLIARSAGECWLLMADSFGSTFHRMPPEVFVTPPMARLQGNGLFHLEGHVLRGKTGRVDLSALGDITSIAVLPQTIAVTGKYTHGITLVATP